MNVQKIEARIVDATREGQGREVGRLQCDVVPTAEQAMLEVLRDLAARTHSQLLELVSEPGHDRCDRMVVALAEVATACRRLNTELRRNEQQAD
jgi:hypothetical protein